MQLIDNINQTLRNDLVATIKSGSRVSIAAAKFSIYAFQELKEQLKDIDELRFIFTSPRLPQRKQISNVENFTYHVLTVSAIYLVRSLR